MPNDTADRRPIQACQRCRELHIKCGRRSGASRACASCKSLGVKCKLKSSLQFKNKFGSVSSEARSALRKVRRLRYHDETPDIIRFYEGNGDEEPRNLNSNDQPVASSVSRSSSSDGENGETATISAPNPTVSAQTPTQWSDWVPQEYHSSPTYQTTPISLPLVQTPVSTAVTLQTITDSEAELMRNYIENIATWADATDYNRSFEIEVPRRAIQEPVLLHAVCTFSALHLDRHKEAQEHQDKCIQLLIPALSSLKGIDDTVLASVAILRQIEEMNENDERFHFQGTTRILEVVSDFAHAGGLGEAAAWLCLRENLYVSMMQQIPIQMDLKNFELSPTLQRDDDAAWASRMVLYLAELLSAIFSRQDISTIDATGQKIDEWNTTKPLSFYPIRIAAKKPFPDIWMLSTPHVIAAQYFHIAQILLAVSGVTVTSDQSDMLRRGRNVERLVQHHLVRILGLCQSNVRSENALFMARHCLAVWGAYLTNHVEQEGAISLLRDIEARTR